MPSEAAAGEGLSAQRRAGATSHAAKRDSSTQTAANFSSKRSAVLHFLNLSPSADHELAPPSIPTHTFKNHRARKVTQTKSKNLKTSQFFIV